jgi:hypothetical protein
MQRNFTTVGTFCASCMATCSNRGTGSHGASGPLSAHHHRTPVSGVAVAEKGARGSARTLVACPPSLSYRVSQR